MIPTWNTAGHALGAYRSIRKYYPDIPVYFITDFTTEQGINDWKRLMIKGWDSLDTDYAKISGLPNSTLIWKEHKGWETEGHGNAVTYAMQFIHTKWVVHLSDDVRIIKEGVLEMMLGGDNKKVVAIGEDFTRDWLPNVGKWLCMYRGDLYHKYKCDFRGNYEKCLDAGTLFFKEVMDRGYKLKFVNLDGYFLHLTSVRNEQWDKYYTYEQV